MTTAQNNTKGILFILIGMVVFSIQDALIKFIYEDSALYELYLGRTLSAAFFLFCYMKFTKQKINFKTHYPFLTTLRIICFFFGFSFFRLRCLWCRRFCCWFLLRRFCFFFLWSCCFGSCDCLRDTSYNKV